MDSEIIFQVHTSSDYSIPSSPISRPLEGPVHLPLPIAFENPICPEDIAKPQPAPLPRPMKQSIEKRWSTLEEAKAWMTEEQSQKMFSFASKDIIHPRGAAVDWTQKLVYVCSRGSSGGKSKYKKKYSWIRKKPRKATGCQCRLRLAVYPDHVKGKYTEDHNHALGVNNARFTAISEDTRREIEAMLRSGMDPSKVLRQIHRQIYKESNLSQLRTAPSRREDFISRADVRRIQKAIEEELVRLAKGDGESVLLWVEKLRKEGHYVFLKTSRDAPASDSRLDPGAFVLIIQTGYQRECWEKHGKRFAGIDATHNTTHYENMSLFTLLCRDRWGHGMPCGWMVSSNGTEETITYFLKTLRDRSPLVIPEYFMSDKDSAQMNAIQHIFPTSALFLCWWHVLHAWQQHFSITAYPELWQLMKTWPRIIDDELFRTRWADIKVIAPASVIEYLETFWMPIIPLWSALYRRGRNIFQQCDTNMLLEAWHHLLKGKFMQGKRNRRLDQLIHILIEEAIPYFIQRHHSQQNGFEGGDLEVQARLRIEEAARKIPNEDIEEVAEDGNIFRVKSQTHQDTTYTVDLEAYDCTCRSFETILMCKHIHAVQLHFSEQCEPIHASPFDVTSSDTFEHDGPTFISAQQTDVNDNDNDQQPKPALDVCSHAQSRLISSLTTLAAQLHDAPSSSLDLNDITTLQSALGTFSRRLPSKQSAALLPDKENIAPNQHSWTETAAIMGVRVKSKRKSAHKDPYAGGERSGKRAKPDATGTSAPKASQTTLALPSTTAFSPADFNLKDVAALSKLKRPQLFQLCELYGFSKTGTNLEVIERLRNVVHSS